MEESGVSRFQVPSRNRFSMVEAWSVVSDGTGTAVYAIGNNFKALKRMSVDMIAVDPRFDLERYDYETEETRTAKSPSNPPHRPELGNGLQSYTENKSANKFINTSYPDEKKAPKVDFGPLSPVPELVIDKAEFEKPYHVFTSKQKWSVVIIIGVAGLFSGLSSNIYFPSLGQIASDLSISLSAVNLTITSYLIVQGFSPVIWGAFSDALGRRPIYIASFSIYIIANIALSFSPNFAVLMIFRGLQAAGSASTVSIGNGVIQDICPPATRGAFISFYQALRNFSIAVGPVLGGALASSFGFRSIFVFLLIISSVVLMIIIVFLPETMRKLAGDGSLRLGGIYQPLIYRVRGEPLYMQEPGSFIAKKKITVFTFIEPLKLLIRKEVLLNLLFGGVVYTIWSMVTSSTTSLFTEKFHIDGTLLGVAYLPNGLGTIVGSTLVGHLMNEDFKKAEVQYKRDKGLPDDYKLPTKDIPVDFPIEKARQKNIWWVTSLFIISTGIYGFSLDTSSVTKVGWITVPLFLQFLISSTSNAIFAMNQTLVSDLCPGKGASSTAINNLVRCSLGAVGVAFIEEMISSIGPGITFFVLAIIIVVSVPLAVVSSVWGMQWRAERAQKSQLHQKQMPDNATSMV